MTALQFTAPATTSLHRRRRGLTTPKPLNCRKPLLSVSCAHISFPAQHNRRKNFLRQKILKTLRKPLTPNPPPLKPIFPIDDSPPIQNLEEVQNVEEEDELVPIKNLEEELVGVEIGNGNASILSKNEILKYGFWLVGAFVFQTVCVVWFFGDIDTKKNGISESSKKSSVLEVGRNGGGVDSLVYVDDLEMEKKIKEIRVLARDARKEERLESMKKSFVRDEEEGLRSEVEEEVDNRMIKLRNKLGNARKSMVIERKDGLEKSGLNEIEGNDALLLFKKKYKFKGLSDNPREKPKGFVGSDDTEFSGSLDGNGVKDGVSSTESNAVVEVTETTKNTQGMRNQGKGRDDSKPKGFGQEKSNGKSVVEAVKMKKSSTRDSMLSNESVDAKSATKSDSESKTDFWWLKLPYVLAICMRKGRDGDGEGSEGWYTLRSTYGEENLVSHIVAFEDQVDANNFCYLLESFFEDIDLKDFKADIVPLTTKELREDVKLQRVIVVKKGQLRLYAGQPLDEVETCLRAMVKQG